MAQQVPHSMSREEFLMIRNSYLTSAQPIQSPQHLKGRARPLQVLLDALTSPGRHAFIYGYRGVGKSSLAQTTAFQLQHSTGSPLLIGCEPTSTFAQICGDIIRLALSVDPLEKKGQTKFNLGATVAGYGGNIGVERAAARQEIQIRSVNDAIAHFKSACQRFSPGFMAVVDEFDQLAEPEEHNRFALLLKQLSDQKIPVRFIFCGIADSIEKLFSQHASIFRQVHCELVDRLNLQACLEIIEDASKALKIEMRSDFKFRIAQISDGFPAFVHLISEKVFTATFDRGDPSVTQEAYEQGILEAIGSVELTLKRNYENALHRNTHKYEHVIWAVANDKLLDVNIDMIWKHYIGVCDQLRITPVTRSNLTTKLNQLAQPQYGTLLAKPRRSNYTFTEKMMRAYARLRAERHECHLGPENPALVAHRVG
jgi:energy-coupling factor transporter ATP-binding protein EcfA2